ncbi:hypothetical protein [Geomicrobium sp. JCM 19039]|uniref:hypothetical protein n=1 Tax=Geomicrobium sp. JCM 19039 TaxID=1460636 RepID=UPI0012683C80|nr:hypothetical protein [Geomicrobium sp. JCM 19039]
MKFLLRMLYFPPSHLKSYESSQYTGALLVSFEKLLARYIREKKRTDHFRLLQSEADVSIAFLTVVEGCFIELFFGDVGRFERRVQAILPLFLNGMRK